MASRESPGEPFIVMSYKVVNCPHGGALSIERMEIGLFDEYLAISPTLTLLYNINKDSPNPALKKYGHIFSYIPGDAIIVGCDEDGETTDVPDDVVQNLPGILKRDSRAREEFLEFMGGL